MQANTEEPLLFAIMFEGRTGSSELVARLNSHPDIQAYPEILAPLAPLGSDSLRRWHAIEDVFVRLRNRRSIETFFEVYSKQDESASMLPIRGFKTRLNVMEDAQWFIRAGKVANFYCIEPDRFLDLAKVFDIRLIYLHRRDLLKHAISWMRAVELSKQRHLWNMRASDGALGALPISLQQLRETLLWLQAARERHRAAFDQYNGCKITIAYEDMVYDWARCESQVLRFLGARDYRLESFYVKMTDDDLSVAVSNYAEMMEFMQSLGLDELTNG